MLVCVVFEVFLDDWGTKYWWISLKLGTEVVDIRFYDIYSGCFQIKKKLLYRFSQKISFFLDLGIKKSKFWNVKITILYSVLFYIYTGLFVWFA